MILRSLLPKPFFSPKNLSAQTHFAVCAVNTGFLFWSVLCVFLAWFINGLVKQVLLQLPLPFVNPPRSWASRARNMSLCGTRASHKLQSKCQEALFSSLLAQKLCCNSGLLDRQCWIIYRVSSWKSRMLMFIQIVWMRNHWGETGQPICIKFCILSFILWIFKWQSKLTCSDDWEPFLEGEEKFIWTQESLVRWPRHREAFFFLAWCILTFSSTAAQVYSRHGNFSISELPAAYQRWGSNPPGRGSTQSSLLLVTGCCPEAAVPKAGCSASGQGCPWGLSCDASWICLRLGVQPSSGVEEVKGKKHTSFFMWWLKTVSMTRPWRRWLLSWTLPVCLPSRNGALPHAELG